MVQHDVVFESMGTNWKITIWDHISSHKLNVIKKQIIQMADEFDSAYSRFQKKSFVKKIENKIGKIKVSTDFINMLFLYTKLNQLSDGMINPLIGNTISDLGYDENYSLQKKSLIRKTPQLSNAIEIIDSTYIKKNLPCLFDFGALGKGYFVDLISFLLYQEKVKTFLVNGSGDIYYQGEKSITAGLEHPNDPKKVIGTLPLQNAALCASGINRRRWKEANHIINPVTHKSASEIIATWVIAESAALADGLATALFLCPPENFLKEFRFEYFILNKNYKVKRSSGFNAKLF